MKLHRASLMLIFGNPGLLACQPPGIFAWIMGAGDLKETEQGRPVQPESWER